MPFLPVRRSGTSSVGVVVWLSRHYARGNDPGDRRLVFWRYATATTCSNVFNTNAEQTLTTMSESSWLRPTPIAGPRRRKRVRISQKRGEGGTVWIGQYRRTRPAAWRKRAYRNASWSRHACTGPDSASKPADRLRRAVTVRRTESMPGRLRRRRYWLLFHWPIASGAPLSSRVVSVSTLAVTSQ